MRLEDRFLEGVSPYWIRFMTGHAQLETEPGIARFVVEGAEEGALSDVEIDDHRAVPRSRLRWRPPIKLTVRARFSHPAGAFLGTAGFGFWNDPFDWVGNVQTPPNALWFFYASPPSKMSFVRGVRGHGWKAAMLNGGTADRLTMAAGNFVFRLPGLSRWVFELAGKRVRASETLLDEIELTEWHTYELVWTDRAALFTVDGREVARAESPPTVPLGFVAWVDNNCTTMGPGQEMGFRRMAIAQRQWMELSCLRLDSASA